MDKLEPNLFRTLIALYCRGDQFVKIVKCVAQITKPFSISMIEELLRNYTNELTDILYTIISESPKETINAALEYMLRGSLLSIDNLIEKVAKIATISDKHIGYVLDQDKLFEMFTAKHEHSFTFEIINLMASETQYSERKLKFILETSVTPVLKVEMFKETDWLPIDLELLMCTCCSNNHVFNEMVNCIH